MKSGMIGLPVGSANGPAQSVHNESGLLEVSTKFSAQLTNK